MRIQILPEQDARRIAAGEVVERPASALRELLDNALDAESTKISIHLEEGGLKKLEVADNGMGMDKEDLSLSIMVHATSKIRCLEDLDRSYTLGFRGEALASLTACSRVIIISRPKNQEIGHILHTYLGGQVDILPTSCDYGTKVSVEQIFYNLPARKRFLKSAGYEQKECLQVFYEKALAHPHVQFQYTVDGQLKYHFTRTDLPGRAKQIFGHALSESPFILHTEGSLQDEGFTASIVAGTPQNYYHNRRYIHIYVNGRRIEEYALVQAVVYAYDTILPGGQFPVAFVFLQVRADLVDFNIHPAKREAKIRNLSAIHKAIVQLLQSHLQPNHTQLQALSHQHLLTSTPVQEPELIFSFSEQQVQHTGHSKKRHTHSEDPVPSSSQHKYQSSCPWTYLGQTMGVFLLVERGKTLLLIDQHAAHERILFDQISQQPLQSQHLLNPITLDVTEDERNFILTQKDSLAEQGIVIDSGPDQHTLLITACPTQMNAEFWHNVVKGDARNLKKELYASMACKHAIKEGEILDQQTALKLIEQTLALKEPFCPHGRPLWIELTEVQLYQWIKRIV